MRNVITRALGTQSHVTPDVFDLDAEPGDLFLLCTDGLTREVPDSGIEEVLSAEGDLETLCKRLVDAAVRADSKETAALWPAEATTSHACSSAWRVSVHPRSPNARDRGHPVFVVSQKDYIQVRGIPLMNQKTIHEWGTLSWRVSVQIKSRSSLAHGGSAHDQLWRGQLRLRLSLRLGTHQFQRQLRGYFADFRTVLIYRGEGHTQEI